MAWTMGGPLLGITDELSVDEISLYLAAKWLTRYMIKLLKLLTRICVPQADYTH